MPATPGSAPFDVLSRRWHTLAERRLAYYAELYRSGRWTLYFKSREDFASSMMRIIEAEKIWAHLADPSQPAAGKPAPAAPAGAEQR
jgi:hypothetical protein